MRRRGGCLLQPSNAIFLFHQSTRPLAHIEIGHIRVGRVRQSGRSLLRQALAALPLVVENNAQHSHTASSPYPHIGGLLPRIVDLRNTAGFADADLLSATWFPDAVSEEAKNGRAVDRRIASEPQRPLFRNRINYRGRTMWAIQGEQACDWNGGQSVDQGARTHGCDCARP